MDISFLFDWIKKILCLRYFSRETAIDKTILSAAAAPEIKVEKTQKPIEIPPLNYGPGAEAKIRQTEQIRSKPLPQPTSEGRMRLQDPRGRREKPSATVVAKSVPKNPFESDYDDDKNPFKDDEEEEFDEKNPFGKGYCDKNLNPFED